MDDFTTVENTSTDRSRYASQIRGEQIRAVYARLVPIIAFGVVLSSMSVAIALSGLTSDIELMWWLLGHLAVNAVLAAGYALFRRHVNRATREPLQHVFGLILAVGMFLLGAYWSAVFAYYYLLTGGMLYHLYVFLAWGGLCSLALAVLGDYLPAFHAFVWPTSLLLMYLSAAKGTADYLLLTAMCLLYTVALTFFASGKNRALATALRLRYALKDFARQAREQRDLAQRANISKSKFLAAASHDLRQPLHALSLLNLTLQTYDLSKSVREISNDISAAIGSLEKLFGALLDVSKLDAGVVRAELVHFDVGDLVSRIVDEHAVEAEAKGLRLIFDDDKRTVLSDPLLLELILRNYLSNAIRYTPTGSVRVKFTTVDNHIRIDVIDSGIGIPGALHDEIFDEFYQLGNPERDRSKGLGLGLAIVRRIAKLLNHPIGVDSELGQGARFFIAVPLGDGSQVRNELLATTPTVELTGMRVIVIDDDEAVRGSMRKLLAAWGCDCILAANEDEASDAVRERSAPVHAIVADYRLREHRTGLQAIARLHSDLRTLVPALLVSGDTAPERLREVAESGYSLVHKPLQPHVLKLFLANALRASRTQ